MLSYLAYAIDDPFIISDGHFNTISALHARGAVEFIHQKHWSDNNMHYLVKATPQGEMLYKWATTSKQHTWDDARSAVRAIRKTEYE